MPQYQHDPATMGASEGNRSNNKITTNWQEVSKLMNRTAKDCWQKWNSMQASRMKKGPFTAEEDAIIIQRVTEWGDKGKGLWVSLDKELGRPNYNIRQRWIKSLSKGKA